jgi:hypothetical protein
MNVRRVDHRARRRERLVRERYLPIDQPAEETRQRCARLEIGPPTKKKTLLTSWYREAASGDPRFWVMNETIQADNVSDKANLGARSV